MSRYERRGASGSSGSGVTLPIAESDVTNLTTDLAAKATTAALATTNANVATNTSDIATKAAVIETVNTVATAGSSQTIPDVTTATMHKYTLTASTCTFTMPTAAAGKSFSVALVQDATGSRLATFTGVKWAGGTAPTLSTGASKIDDLVFVCTDTTVGWKGYVSGLDMR